MGDISEKECRLGILAVFALLGPGGFGWSLISDGFVSVHGSNVQRALILLWLVLVIVAAAYITVLMIRIRRGRRRAPET